MSSNDVERALSLDPPDRGQALLGLREDQWFERKSVRVAPRRFAEALVGLANAEGGVVVIGLSDGQLEDVRIETDRVNELRRAPVNLVSPPVRTHFETLDAMDGSGAAVQLLVARVSPGDVVHELANGDVYLRVGDSTMKPSVSTLSKTPGKSGSVS